MVYTSERLCYGATSQKKQRVEKPNLFENKHKLVKSKHGSRQISLSNTGLAERKKVKFTRSKPASKIINDMSYMKFVDRNASQPTFKEQQMRFKTLMDRTESNWQGQMETLEQKV